MSYENQLIREMTDETPPNREDACPVCDKIECVCPPEDFTPSEFRNRIALQLMPPRKTPDKKRIQIQRNRIDACDTILDYLHDDIPWSEQEPLKEILNSLKLALGDEMEDGLDE